VYERERERERVWMSICFMGCVSWDVLMYWCVDVLVC
jgi:hypothetical protein